MWAADMYEKIGMPSEDFANLAEKLMGNRLIAPEE